MASKLDKIARLTEGLGALPSTPPLAPTPAPAAAPAAAPKAETAAVNVRMPVELRDWLVREAAQEQAATGKPVTAQQVILEAVRAWREGRTR